MTNGPLFELYSSDLQSTYALWIVPLLFLSYLATAGRRRAGASTDPAASFVRTYSLVFAFETLLDSFATGPLSRWLGIAGTTAGTILMLAFVLLGDFRVLVLVLRLARPKRHWLRDAALWTFVVPLFAWAIDGDLRRRWPGLPDQTIWLVYEIGFLVLALVWRSLLVPGWAAAAGESARLPFLRAVLLYAAIYYALWALADVLILVLGLDVGWGLRIVPNQLYYGFWVPFVFFRFFRERA